MSESFYFRWGITELDGGFITVPNAFLDRYGQLGIKRTEFLLIIHLARYKYERPGSECRPSLTTVAEQMDVSERYVRKLVADLEEKGWLKRTARPGKPNLYDFAALSEAVRQAELEDTPEREFKGTPELEARTPLNQGSDEEEQQEQQANNNAAGGSVVKLSTREGLLVEFGISLPVAKDLATQCSEEAVRAWLDYARRAVGIENPQGLVVSGLRSGNMPPSEPAVPEVAVPGGDFS